MRHHPKTRTPDKDCGADGAKMVSLSVAVGKIKSLPDWEALAREQPTVNVAALQSAGKGEFFALEDRNLITAPWRRIFAVFDGHSFVVFDQQGNLIVEPLDGLVAGRQVKEVLVQEFAEDEEGFYYRAPVLRRTPLDRTKPASSIDGPRCGQTLSSSRLSMGQRMQQAAIAQAAVSETQPQPSTKHGRSHRRRIPAQSEDESDDEAHFMRNLAVSLRRRHEDAFRDGPTSLTSETSSTVGIGKEAADTEAMQDLWGSDDGCDAAAGEVEARERTSTADGAAGSTSCWSHLATQNPASATAPLHSTPSTLCRARFPRIRRCK